jgi:hypothetical protein
VTEFNKNPDLHEVQVVVFPEHSAQVSEHCWHDPSMLENPVEHDEVHCPFWKTPLIHLQTPLTGDDPAGH